jgi:hypothetical protein
MKRLQPFCLYSSSAARLMRTTFASLATTSSTPCQRYVFCNLVASATTFFANPLHS